MHLLRVGLLLIPGFSLGKEIEECCKRKIVGDDIYNFIKQVGEAKSEFGCMNDCVYSIEGKPDSMFCFRSGDQRAVCQDSSDSTDSTDSTGSTDLTDLTDECFIDENTDYPGMDLNPETGRTTDRRDSALACRDLCNQNKDCKYFGWKAHSRECWLKTGISKKVVQSGTTSGTACRTECLPGWSQFESKCYKIFEEKKPWKEAQAICQEEGSNLASIISSSNNKFIEELIVKTPVEYPWIGASLFSSELKEFKWIDGTPFVYENWDTDQPIYNPREACVEFVNGKWHDFLCDFPRAFICQKIEGWRPILDCKHPDNAITTDGSHVGSQLATKKFTGDDNQMWSFDSERRLVNKKTGLVIQADGPTMQEPLPLTEKKQWRYRIDIRSSQETAEPTVPKIVNGGENALNTATRFDPAGSAIQMYPANGVYPENACWLF